MTEGLMIEVGQFLNYAWLVFLAGSGGYLSYLIECRKEGMKPKLLDGLIKTMGSAFTGVIALYGCLYFEMSEFGMGMVVGISGWAGPHLLDFAVSIMKLKAESWAKQ